MIIYFQYSIQKLSKSCLKRCEGRRLEEVFKNVSEDVKKAIYKNIHLFIGKMFANCRNTSDVTWRLVK